MLDIKTALYQIDQLRVLEKLAMQDFGLSSATLMQRAGLAAFNILRGRWPFAKQLLIFCGKGNNGGDGYELAAIAHQQGLQVSIRYLGELAELSGYAQQAAAHCQTLAIDTQAFRFDETLTADVVVDALLGIGFKGKLTLALEQAIIKINQLAKPVLALDIPSGVAADTGEVATVAVVANITLTFLALKPGLFTGSAKGYCGEVLLEPLGLPLSAYGQVETTIKILNYQLIKQYLLPRRRDAYKGHFGHVLVIGGNKGMSGAVRMAAEAAARVGAGLVSIATRPEHAAIISSVRPELMCHGIEQAEELMPLLARATVIVIGPGLGKDRWAQDLLSAVLSTQQPKVCDADALSLLAQLSSKNTNWILTPHPGEAARLLDCTVEDIASDRFAAVKQLQHRYSGVCLLKGAGTLVATEEKITYICTAGNPGMASGGMGDVLSGVLGGFLAQGSSLSTAACMGVQLHAMAADNCAANLGERGLLALDLLAELRKLVNPAF